MSRGDFGLEKALASAEPPPISPPVDDEAFGLLSLEQQRAFWEEFFLVRPQWPKEPTGGPGACLTKEEAKAAGLTGTGGYRLGVEEEEPEEEAEAEEPPPAEELSPEERERKRAYAERSRARLEGRSGAVLEEQVRKLVVERGPMVTKDEIAKALGTSTVAVQRAINCLSDRSEVVFPTPAPLSVSKETTMPRKIDPKTSERREKVLALIKAGKTQSEICKELKMSQGTASKDFTALRAAGKIPKVERPSGAQKPGPKAKASQPGLAPKKPKRTRAKKPKKVHTAKWGAGKPGTVAKGFAGVIPMPEDILKRVVTSVERDTALATLREELAKLDEDANAIRITIGVLERRKA